jgi:hypothetical protein
MFLNIYFDIIMTCCFNTFFILYIDKHNVIVSNFHYEFIFFLELIHILKYDFHQSLS